MQLNLNALNDIIHVWYLSFQCNHQEFIGICKNLSEEQVTEAFNKYDTSGDNK